jgi:hypothetical protein
MAKIVYGYDGLDGGSSGSFAEPFADYYGSFSLAADGSLIPVSGGSSALLWCAGIAGALFVGYKLLGKRRRSKRRGKK